MMSNVHSRGKRRDRQRVVRLRHEQGNGGKVQTGVDRRVRFSGGQNRTLQLRCVHHERKLFLVGDCVRHEHVVLEHEQ